MRHYRSLASALVLVFVSGMSVAAQQRASLSPAETEKLRDTQDPGERIKVYLDLMQTRLTTFEAYRGRPVNPEYLTGKFLNEVLGQYVELDDELKDWIQYQYNRDGDMRSGLRALLDRAPRQLQELKHARATPDPYTSKYSDTLGDAVANLEDTLNGAATALEGQEKKLGALKQRAKAAKNESKSEIKAEKKRIKEEEKLRKREEKKQGATDSNNN